MQHPDCEICGEDAGQHTITVGGEKLKVCTGCMLEALGNSF